MRLSSEEEEGSCWWWLIAEEEEEEGVDFFCRLRFFTSSLPFDNVVESRVGIGFSPSD